MQLATVAHAGTTVRREPRPRSSPVLGESRPTVRVPLAGSPGHEGANRATHAAQGGFFDDLLGTAVPGLLGAAGSALSGDTAGALGQVRSTGAAAAPALAQHGAGALGGLIGGQAGQVVSSLGAPLGQGLGSVISGEASPGQAAGGFLSAAQPALLSLLMSLLNR